MRRRFRFSGFDQMTGLASYEARGRFCPFLWRRENERLEPLKRGGYRSALPLLQSVATKRMQGGPGGFIHFLARSEKTNQKRGATPKAPFKGGCNRSSCRSDTNVSSDHHRSGLSFLWAGAEMIRKA